VFNTVKTLKKIPENEYESEQCLDYFKKIDSSYNEDKSARMDIAKAIVESGFPGKINLYKLINIMEYCLVTFIFSSKNKK
jgi:hypothetical protein